MEEEGIQKYIFMIMALFFRHVFNTIAFAVLSGTIIGMYCLCLSFLDQIASKRFIPLGLLKIFSFISPNFSDLTLIREKEIGQLFLFFSLALFVLVTIVKYILRKRGITTSISFITKVWLGILTLTLFYLALILFAFSIELKEGDAKIPIFFIIGMTYLFSLPAVPGYLYLKKLSDKFGKPP